MANLITDIGRGAKETQDGFVRIKYRIDKLKAKLKNVDKSDEHFHEWGFSVIIRGHQKGDLKDKAYNPFIVKLPYEIVPTASYFTVEDNFLFAWLKKKDENQSWESEINSDELETAEKGFSVIIRGHQKGDLKDKAYNPFIVKLPYEIVPTASYFTVEDNFLFAWLKKKDENQSWESEINSDELETAEKS